RFEVSLASDSVRLRVWYAGRSEAPAVIEDASFATIQVDSAVGRVRDRLLGRLALRLHPRFSDWPDDALTRHPEAARAFAEALKVKAMWQDPLAGHSSLAEAVRFDPDFDLAKLLMVEEFQA